MNQVPYYVINKVNGRCLEMGGDGSYPSAVTFLNELTQCFGALCEKHLEWGSRPEWDKEKGYWRVQMFGEAFFFMRHCGYGMCLWGPKPPVSDANFLRVCQHFGAAEKVTRLQRVARALGLRSC